MVAIVAQWRRVTVVDGENRREILLSTHTSVGESLHNEGVDMSSREVFVVAADGSRIDTGELPRVTDGALLTIIDVNAPGPVGSAVQKRRTPGAYDFSTALWMFVAIAAFFVTLSAATGVISASDSLLGAVIRYAAVIVLAGLAVVSVFTTSRVPGIFSSTALVVPASLGFAAGFLAIPATLEAWTHLAIFTGFVAAAIAVGGVQVRNAGTVIAGATGLLTITFTVLGTLWGATLVMGLDASVAAALIAGAAPVALRILPSLCLDIPEGQLLEYGEFMQNRWTVRGPIPPESRPVTARDLAGTMTRARVQLGVGTVVFSALPAVMMPAVLAAPKTDAIAGIAGIVLVAVIVVSFALSPRAANGPLLRWSPRVAASIVALQFALSLTAGASAIGLLLAAGAVVLVALGVAAATVPLTRGVRSLGVSRIADILENLSTALAFPAAFVAANLIDILRGAVS